MTFNRLALGCLLAALCAASVSAAEDSSRIVSWNAYSIQFIDPPAFQLLALPDAAVYRAIVEQGDKKWEVRSKHPRLDLASIWTELSVRWFSVTFDWLNAQGIAGYEGGPPQFNLNPRAMGRSGGQGYINRGPFGTTGGDGDCFYYSHPNGSSVSNCN